MIQRVYIKDRPSTVVRTPENITRSRKNLSVAMFKQWFSDVRSYLNNHDLSEFLKADPTRFFNLDEWSFSLDSESSEVLCIKGMNNCFVEKRNQKTKE